MIKMITIWSIFSGETLGKKAGHGAPETNTGVGSKPRAVGWFLATEIRRWSVVALLAGWRLTIRKNMF